MKITGILLSFVILVVILAACMANGGILFTPSGPEFDNSAASQKARADFAMEEAKQQEAEAFAAAVNETAQVQSEENGLALAITATAQALGVARTQLELTANAANISSTQAAMDVEQTAIAIEANAAIAAQSILLVQEQALAIATTQALQLESVTAQQLATTSQRRRVLTSWLIPITAAIALGFVMLFGAKFLSGLIDIMNEEGSLENQRLKLLYTLFDPTTETIAFVDDRQSELHRTQLFFTPNPDYGNSTDLFNTNLIPTIDHDEPSSIYIVSNGDKVLADRTKILEVAENCKLAMKLLRDAINQGGTQSNIIPSASQLGWPIDSWNIAVGILLPYGLERIGGVDGGIYLTEHYPNLQILYAVIGEKRLSFIQTTANDVRENENMFQ